MSNNDMPSSDPWMDDEVGEECGAIYEDPRPDRPAQHPCIKPAGHENGPDTDWKRHLHSNGTWKWPVDRDGKEESR
jgi:hypothetical protein